MTKPFALGELLARLRANLRRRTSGSPSPVVTTIDGRLTIDLAAKTATVNGTPARLTPHEWGIVSYLVSHPNQLVRKDELLENVWGPEYTNEAGYVRVYMSQIHQKLEEDSSAPRCFLTEPGLGHRFVLGG